MVKKRRRRRGYILKTVVIVLVIYTAVIAAGAWFYDARHAEILLNGPEEVVLEYGEAYQDAGAEAYSTGRLFGTRELELETDGPEGFLEIGTYQVRYRCSYHKEMLEETRTVTVRDTNAPVITLVPDEHFNATKADGFREAGYSASDNHDGDLTARVEVQVLEDKVIYTVSDLSGNVTTEEREILWAPSEPTLLLYGDSTVSIPAALNYTDPGYAAYDGIGAEVTGQVEISFRKEGESSDTQKEKDKDISEFTPYLPGTYYLTYTVEYSGTLKKQAERTVIVMAAELPKSEAPAKKTVYLTFDDGPGPYTEELLDVLKYYGVKATFFVTNQFPDYTDLLSREFIEGHTVAVHTYCHDYKTIYSGVEEYCEDFFQMRELIYEKTGYYTNMFRFPGGSSNTVSAFNKGIMTTLSQTMPALGYKAFDWNCSSGDAAVNSATSDYIFNYATTGPEGIEQAINTFGYAVLLQHDTKDFSVEAVSKIIEWGLAKGYEFAAMDMTSPRAWHAVNN